MNFNFAVVVVVVVVVVFTPLASKPSKMNTRIHSPSLQKQIDDNFDHCNYALVIDNGSLNLPNFSLFWRPGSNPN